MSAPSNREETLFEEALGLASPEARDDFLRDACGSDAEMRERLRGLLAAHDRAGRFLEHKAPVPKVPTPAGSEPACPRCGQPLAAGTPQGLCPGCLLLGGLLVVPPSGGSEGVTPSSDPIGEPAEAGITNAPTVLDPVIEKPGNRIGHYKLLEQIGEGGMGTVWMAEQEEPVRRRVALKIIKLGMDTRSVIARFEAERQALALMDHPNIARVFDGGATGAESRAGVPPAPAAPAANEAGPPPNEDAPSAQGRRDARPTLPAGRPYFVMELVRGLPITKYCEEAKLSTRERLELFGQVCRAVQHAHQKGIIHRDLKPSNILVTVQDDRPVVKVIDFGIAKATEGRLTDKTLFTGFQQLIGTPAYMSPEQASLGSLDIDTRSDTYSLGVVLYELLTGHPPFDTKELLKSGYEAILRTIRETEPVKPSTRLKQERSARPGAAAKSEIENPKSKIDPDLDWIVMKCLEKDRARRYETANGLATDIERYLHDELVLARPPSPLYRCRKFVRKHRTAVAVAAGFVLLLTAATAVSTALAFWAKSEASKSQQVARFLQDMLQGVGPSVARGRDTTMLREILAKTAERLNQGLHGQPEVQTELLNTLGEVSVALAEFGQAETWLAKAVALRRRMPGRQQAALAKSLDNLANALRGKGQLVEAEKIGREALELRRQLFGNGDTNVAASLNNLGVTLTIEGKFADAEAAIRQALEIRTNRLGAEQPEVAVSFNCLAYVLGAQGRLFEAEPVQRQAVAISRKVLPTNDLDLAITINNLAGQLATQGKLSEAEPLFQEVLGIQRALVGAHPDTAMTLNNLGVIADRQGEWAQAEHFHREALAIRRKAFTNDDWRVAFSLDNLASVLAAQGKLADAESMHRQGLAMRRKVFGEEHPDVAASLASVGRVLRFEGRLTESESLQRQALAMREKLLEPEHATVAVSLNDLGLVLREQRRLAEAEATLQRALAVRRKKLHPDDVNLAVSTENLALLLSERGNLIQAEALAREAVAIRETNSWDDWRTFNARSVLGVSLLLQQKYAEAEPLLVSGYEGMAERQRKIPAANQKDLRAAGERLVQLYETWGKPEQAARWREKLNAPARPSENFQP